MNNDKKKLHFQLILFHWEILTSVKPTDRQKFKVKTWLKNYEFSEIMESMNISHKKYAYDENMSLEEVFDKVGGILYNRNLDSTDKGKRYLINTIKKLHGTMYSEAIEDSVNELFYFLEKWEIKYNIVEDEIIPKVYGSWDIFECMKEIDKYTKSMKNLSDDIVM